MARTVPRGLMVLARAMPARCDTFNLAGSLSLYLYLRSEWVNWTGAPDEWEGGTCWRWEGEWAGGALNGGLGCVRVLYERCLWV